MKKQALRDEFLKKRSDLSLVDAADASRQVADRFFSTVDIRSMSALHTFIRIRKFNELDTSVIYFRVWRDRPQMRTFAPRSDLSSGGMESVEFGPATDLVENTWGIREPASGAVAAASEIDIVLVPLLAADLSGNRVGYGRGFYDRFLGEVRSDCMKVGLSYFPPVALIEDAGKHDVRLDLLITPDAAFEFENSSI